MNILETLVKLRDDLKAWVTNNLNALNAKIEEKTIPIDNQLSSTSTNPVQNKVISSEISSLNSLVGDTPVATQISAAIANQDHFSGDYNDLKNAPNISEDGSGDMIVADESGNIIFKVDAKGAHTTDVEIAGTSLGAKIPVWDAKADFSGDYNDLTNAPDIVEDGSKNLTIADEDGNIIFKVDEAGAHTTALTLNGKDVESAINKANSIEIDDALSSTSTNPVQNKVVSAEIDHIVSNLIGDTSVATQISTALASQDFFSGDYNDLKNAPDILEDGNGNLTIADESGNIIFKVDEFGAHTTALTLSGKDVETAINAKADQSDIEATNADVADLQDLVGDTKVSTQISEAIAKQNHFSGDYNDLTNAPDITEDGSGNMIIADESGNIIFRSDGSGLETTQLTAQTAVVGGVNIGATIDSHETLINNKVDKEEGKGLSEANFTVAEKEKLSKLTDNGVIDITVDAALSPTSTNPVQNKVVYAEISNLNSLIGGLAQHTGNVNNPHNITLSQLGVDVDATELNYVDGVTSKIQDQIDALSNEISNIDTPVNTETWEFTLENGSIVAKDVCIGHMTTETWKFTLKDGSVVTKEVRIG